MTTIRMKHASVEFTDWGAVTRFGDGTWVNSVPQFDDHHYWVIANRCGYVDDVMKYCQEHEFCHSLLAEVLSDEPSQVLWALAHGQTLSLDRIVQEEIATQALQRWIRANERPIVGEMSWLALRSRALAMLGDGT